MKKIISILFSMIIFPILGHSISVTQNSSSSGGGSPTGAAGGVLTGTYPNPGLSNTISSTQSFTTDVSLVSGGSATSYVGIRTIVPRAALDILVSGAIGTNGNTATGLIVEGPYQSGNSGTSLLSIEANNASNAADTGGNIVFQASRDGSANLIPTGQIRSGRSSGVANDRDGYMSFWTQSHSGGGTMSERMRLTQEGNLALFRTTAGYGLDISSDARISNNLIIGGALTNNVATASTMTILGVTDASNAPPGYYGEYISTTPTAAANLAASTAFTSVATTTLTAGDWDVSGTIVASDGATTAGTQIAGCISKTANACEATGGDGLAEVSYTLIANDANYIATPVRRISVSATTGVYLTGAVTYTVLGGATYSSLSILRARRVR